MGRTRIKVSAQTQNDPGMDYISYLPIEILEEIFQFLTKEDLLKCCYVSLKWREAINSNKIWSAQCARENILRKKYLQTSCSLMTNPMKRFREPTYEPDSRLSGPCHWRSHYNRYKFLEKNWRKGNYCLTRSNINPWHYNDGLLIGIHPKELAVSSIHNPDKAIFIKKAYPSLDVDAVRVKDGLLFYTQENRLICMKKVDSSFIKHYEIAVEKFTTSHSNDRTIGEPMLSVEITENFIVIQDKTYACFLWFYNYKSGELLRQVNLHRFTGHPCPQITCLVVCGSRVFIAYSLIHHNIIIYDYQTDKVEVNVETSISSSQIVASKNFFCSKLIVSETDKTCELRVWSVHTGFAVDLLCANQEDPVLLTSDDKLIYSEHHTVHVRGLVDTSADVEFSFEGRLMNMEVSWGNLLVLNLGSSLQLWDLTRGQKLHTYIRGCIGKIWIDDSHIVVRPLSTEVVFAGLRQWYEYRDPGYIIGFW